MVTVFSCSSLADGWLWTSTSIFQSRIIFNCPVSTREFFSFFFLSLLAAWMPLVLPCWLCSARSWLSFLWSQLLLPAFFQDLVVYLPCVRLVLCQDVFVGWTEGRHHSPNPFSGSGSISHVALIINLSQFASLSQLSCQQIFLLYIILYYIILYYIIK